MNHNHNNHPNHQHQKRSQHRPNQQQHYMPVAPQYIDYAYSAPVYATQQQTYYPPPNYFAHTPPYVSANAMFTPETHSIHLTTPAGEKVDLKGMKASTPKMYSPVIRQAAITPKTQNAALNTHNRTPSSASPAPADPNTLTIKSDFKAQIMEKAAAANRLPKNEGSSSEDQHKATDQTSSKEKTNSDEKETPQQSSIEVTKPEPEVESKVKAEKSENKADPETESKTEPEPKPEAASKQDTKEVIKEDVKEDTPKKDTKEETKEVTKEDAPKKPKEDSIEITKEPVPESAAKESPSVKIDEQKTDATKESSEEKPKVTEAKPSKEESKPESEIPITKAETTEVKPDTLPPKPLSPEEISKESETKSENSDQKDADTVSAFLTKISQAEDIKDPFTFQYPTGVQGPDPALRDSSKVHFRYNPQFLIQFCEKSKFTTDDDFKKSMTPLFNNLTDRAKPTGYYRGNFGQGSFQGGAQGSQFMRSPSNIRKYNQDPRSNSRQNSKRKGSSGRGNDRKSNRNRERESEREKEPEPPAEPIEPVKPLEKSANRWVPRSRANKTVEVKYAADGVTPLLTEDEVNRKVKSLLNKLTLELFDPITDQIIEIANQSEYEENAETLRAVLVGIFDKATDEPHWSEMYAQLCAKLCKSIKETVTSLEFDSSGGKLARTMLLTQCQKEYEKGWAESLPTREDGSIIEPEMMTDEYYAMAMAKRRGLGLVRLMGHLFVLRLLSSKVVLSCLKILTTNLVTPGEDNVMNLVELLKTTGPTIDADRTTGKANLDVIFEKIAKMTTANMLSRLRFSLEALIELRKNQWKGGEGDKGPKTISQIHEDERKKQLEDQRARNDRSKQRGNESRSNSSRNSVWGSNRVSVSDMKSVGKISSPRSSSDLRPVNNFSKARSRSEIPSQASSPLGARENSKRANSSTPGLGARETSRRTTSNSFNLLKNHDDDDDDEDEDDNEEKDGNEKKEDVSTGSEK